MDLWEIERSCFARGIGLVCGADEAGAGPLAGAVYAAAVILPPGLELEGLNDSKKVSPRKREVLFDQIQAQAVAWAVASVDEGEIDRINILNASFAAMSRAVARLKVVPQMLLIDGNRFRTSLDIPYECIVKGDATFVSIAAASVLAKTYRDDYMNRIAEEYPVYNWKKNKGYPTREHREAVMRYGLSPYHRLSFSSHFAQPDLFGDREQATKP